MKKTDILNSKTTLEYLVLINDKSYSQIGKELNITPQQFSDWIKKRRPIPKERLQLLCQYFDLDKEYLVDEKQFTRNLNPITKIDIQMLLAKKKIELEPENNELYTEKVKELEKERVKQVRIGRLASILHREDERINEMIDQFLDKIEADNIDE
ncbi:helix-turn-helix domain-containing protein [Bacillus solimangrovi]|uniref:HTH cro/C1-type domain-containing protein n=1 Tax=Bacillus solimangrovi TaxID=1305675 RepID=A0A1E5LDA5_9BACI|nr:helix-turn-helix domain-containing protein [Bacillus solimangrovi]OEH92068.1 hypothetical protein BFG57_16995 [Bacillus solimangrovi]